MSYRTCYDRDMSGNDDHESADFEVHLMDTIRSRSRKIKEEFNRKYERDWHCFVIEKGGHSITHDDGCYICLDIGDPMVVLFKQ